MKEKVDSTKQNEFTISEEQRTHLVRNTRTAFEVAKTITDRCTPLLLYGGTIRNLLLNRETSIPDYDFIGDFDPDLIEKEFGEVMIGRWDEVSTMRLKIGSVLYDFTWTKDIKDRLSIGDITVSNMCMTEDGTIIDYYGGLESLAKREIKMIDADKKITTNPVRILRAFRFATELGFTIESETLNSIIRNAHLLEGAKSLDDDIWQILILEDKAKMQVLRSFKQYGIDRFIKYPGNVFETVNLLEIEKDISRCPQTEAVAKMFNTTTYLVGGAVRDMIWGKRVNDLDFKVNASIEEIVSVLEAQGFKKIDSYKTKEHEYYVSLFAGVVGAVINGVDVHLSSVNTSDITELISHGDVNFSCCIYDVHSKRIVNPERIRDIQAKALLFANPEKARNDPFIIINALKQISKTPDVTLPQETRDVIMSSINQIVELARTKPEFRYKIESFCNNINSEEVYSFFGKEHKDIFDGIPEKKIKLATTDSNYVSMPLTEMSSELKDKVVKLLRAGYGKHFDQSKLFNGNVNSIVIEEKNGELQSCCLVDGERMYAVAARKGSDWVGIVADLAKNNYNVWCTVDSNNPKIQALCSIAGLKIEMNPNVIKKILDAKSEKYKDILVYEEDGMTVFRKNNSHNDYPQIMLRS